MPCSSVALRFVFSFGLVGPVVLPGCLHASEAGAGAGAGEVARVHAARFRARPPARTAPGSEAVDDGASDPLERVGSTEPGPAAPADDEAGLDRRGFLAEFVATSPELGAAEARTAAARARIAGAGSVPSPEIAVEAWNVPFRRPYALNDASMWMAIVRQPFEARGVRRARMAAASAEADAELAAEAEAVLAAAVDAIGAHAELAVAQAAVIARADARDAVARVAETTRSLVASGRVSVRDVLVVDAEVARADAAWASAVARERAVRRAINVRIARPPDAALVARVDDTPLDATELHRRLEAHPALRSADARIAAAGARATEARHAARRPRMSAGTGVFVEPTMGVGYGLMVGLELPWVGGRMSGERRVAEADERVARAERETVALRLAIDLERALAELERTNVAITSLDATTLPALERAASATSSGVASGAVSVADVFLARVRLTDAALERVELLGERLRAESTLHALLAVLDAMDTEEGAR